MEVRDLLRYADTVVITSPASCSYFSGFVNQDACILVTDTMSAYLTDSRYEIAAKEIVSDSLSVIILSRDEIKNTILKAISQATTVGIEMSHITVSQYRELGLSEDMVVDVSPIISAARVIKSQGELKKLEKAESIVDVAFSRVLPKLAEGVTEKEVSLLLYNEIVSLGASNVSFDTIVAFGENAAKPHAVPSNRILKKGDAVLLDFGAKVDGYCADFTRTVSFGTPSKDFLIAYNAVLDAHMAVLNAISNGERVARKLDKLARDIIGSRKCKGEFNHSLGHGVGLEIHESPILGPYSNDVLQDGMVFTVEPGVYLEGSYGIRIESLCALINGKFAVLDRSNKELIII